MIEEAIVAPITEDGIFIGEIPAVIGLFGNDGGAGFGGGPLIAGVKLPPKKRCYITIHYTIKLYVL